MQPLIQSVHDKLLLSGDEHTLEKSRHFFREEIRSYGVKIPVVNQIARSHYPVIDALSVDEVLKLCSFLWESGFLEDSFIACDWSYRKNKSFRPGDFEIFQEWVSLYVHNWASCDTLCNHTIGSFIEMYPEKIRLLKLWTNSGNRWMRRASAVTFIIPARKGLFLNDIFEIADLLLEDQDDLVRKGYGWMLKAASQAHQQEVFEYVMNQRSRMPRVSLRYAIEKMPADLRKSAMENKP